MNSGWEEVKLGQISDLQYGYSTSASQSKVGPKFLRITDIVPELIDWKTVPYCKISDQDFEKYKINKWDIVVARTGATAGYGKLIRTHIKAVFAGYLIKITPNKNCDKQFLGRLIESKIFKEYVNKVKGGAAQPQANVPLLKEFTFFLPNIGVQQKIAAILSVYDNLLANNTRRIQILEEMAQRIYKEWFVDFKYPGYEDDQMIDSELGKIPDGWDVKEFGEKITFTRGKNITKKEMVHGEVPVVSAGINPSGFHNVSSVNGPVVTISASGANAGYISYYLRNIWAADCSYINNEMTPYIFYYFSLVKFNSKEITNLQRGAAQPHVYPKDVARISIIDPRVETIEIFENIVENIFNEIGVLRKKISNLRQTRDLLLPKLISGKVDVSDLDIDTSILYD